MGKADKVPDASMEDILASIRKIISESDEEGKEVSELNEEVLELTGSDADEADLSSNELEEITAESLEEGAELEEANADDGVTAVDEVVEDEASDTDEDLSQDNLDSLFDEGEGTSDSADDDMAENIENLDQDALDDVFSAIEETKEEVVPLETDAAAKQDMDEVKADVGSSEELDSLDLAEELVVEESPSSDLPAEEQPVANEAVEIPQQVANNANLVSGDIKRGVSDAFINLENTFLTTSKEIKSLDQLVQDMLRPMLKQWLDDNLEEIVKRMVQKEIDRIIQK